MNDDGEDEPDVGEILEKVEAYVKKYTTSASLAQSIKGLLASSPEQVVRAQQAIAKGSVLFVVGTSILYLLFVLWELTLWFEADPEESFDRATTALLVMEAVWDSLRLVFNAIADIFNSVLIPTYNAGAHYVIEPTILLVIEVFSLVFLRRSWTGVIPNEIDGVDCSTPQGARFCGLYEAYVDEISNSAPGNESSVLSPRTLRRLVELSQSDGLQAEELLIPEFDISGLTDGLTKFLGTVVVITAPIADVAMSIARVIVSKTAVFVYDAISIAITMVIEVLKFMMESGLLKMILDYGFDYITILVMHWLIPLFFAVLAFIKCVLSLFQPSTWASADMRRQGLFPGRRCCLRPVDLHERPCRRPSVWHCHRGARELADRTTLLSRVCAGHGAKGRGPLQEHVQKRVGERVRGVPKLQVSRAPVRLAARDRLRVGVLRVELRPVLGQCLGHVPGQRHVVRAGVRPARSWRRRAPLSRLEGTLPTRIPRVRRVYVRALRRPVCQPRGGASRLSRRRGGEARGGGLVPAGRRVENGRRRGRGVPVRGVQADALHRARGGHGLRSELQHHRRQLDRVDLGALSVRGLQALQAPHVLVPGEFIHDTRHEIGACSQNPVTCKKEFEHCLGSCSGVDSHHQYFDFHGGLAKAELAEEIIGTDAFEQAEAYCVPQTATIKVTLFEGGDSFRTWAARVRVRSGMTAIDENWCQQSPISCGAVQRVLERSPLLTFVDGSFKHVLSFLPPLPPPPPAPPPGLRYTPAPPPSPAPPPPPPPYYLDAEDCMPLPTSEFAGVGARARTRTAPPPRTAWPAFSCAGSSTSDAPRPTALSARS